MTAVGKYWICKRAPAMINDAAECMGGAGYVEDSLLTQSGSYFKVFTQFRRLCYNRLHMAMPKTVAAPKAQAALLIKRDSVPQAIPGFETPPQALPRAMCRRL